MATNNKIYTLCWECKMATGGCRWSNRLKPVVGWNAIRTKGKTGVSYIVLDCPDFVRDAICYGTKRYREDDPLCQSLKTGSMMT